MQFEEKLDNCSIIFDTESRDRAGKVKRIELRFDTYSGCSITARIVLHTDRVINSGIIKQLTEDSGYDIVGLVNKVKPFIGVPYEYYSVMSRENIPWSDIPNTITHEVTHYCPTSGWVRYVDGLWFFWYYGWRDLPERFVETEILEKRPTNL